MTRAEGDAWLHIPIDGPIARVLGRRLIWLHTQSTGDADSRRQTLDDLADDGRTEDRIRQGYTGRAPMELLQNAHDALADAGQRGRVDLRVTPTALLVANQGKPFDAARITSLTRLGSSEKAGRRSTHHQIGYKGIGFTSVFEVSDRPQILSRDVGFAFDRRAAAALVKEHLGDGLDGPVPARYFPLPLLPGELGEDQEVVARLFADGVASVIRLPFRADRPRDEVVEAVRETLVPEILLFLPAVDSFTIDDGDGSILWTRRVGSRSGAGQIVHIDSDRGERRSWLVAKSSTPITPDVVAALDDDLWAGVTHLNAAVALPWSDRGPRPSAPTTRIHSYFPTDDRLGRAVLIHGDFYLDASRRRIELTGAKGDVSRAVMAGCADLSAVLVESVATWGRAALRFVAAEGTPDGAGELFGERLEAALVDRPIARTVVGAERRIPRTIARLGLDLDDAVASRLAAVVKRATDILDPRDDRAETRQLLERLGCRALPPQGVAERLDLSESHEPYGGGLALVSAWLESTSAFRPPLLEILRKRPIVQDLSGTWVAPEAVERRAATSPDMPMELRRGTLLEPPPGPGRALVDTLRITTLDSESALVRLLDAVEKRRFGTTDRQRDEALELAWRIWKVKPSVLSRERARVGAIQVRTRTTRARRERSWRRADTTYFGADWTGDRTLEQLYAPLGKAEFLAEALGTSARERQHRGAFFADLGVAKSPRQVPIAFPSAKRLREWETSPTRAAAWECVNGHPASGRDVDGWMIDRLDDILAALDDPETAAALARGLAMLDEPYGPYESHVRCRNQDHGGRATPNPVIGYQRWRLEETPWVPVAQDPSGATLQVPSRSWRGLPRKSGWLQIPRARLREQDAEKLALVPAERPRSEAVESALEALALAHPELELATVEVRDTADWLLRRLERVLVRGDRRQAGSPPLPTQGPSGALWSRRAVVPNLPGLPALAGIDLLPAGRWPGLHRAYGLELARDRVTAHVRTGPRRPVAQFLSVVLRVNLLAILIRRGADSERTAARLAAIRERPVTALTIAWEVGTLVTPAPTARFVLEPTRDKRGRVIRADFTWLLPNRPNPIELGRALADHLELPDEDAEIALFLTDPSRLIEQRALTRGELEDAERLLRSRRYFAEPKQEPAQRRKAALSFDLTQRSQPEPGDACYAPVVDPPTKQYIDPNGVRFGPASPLAPPPSPEPPAAERPGDAGRRAPARSKPVPGPLAPIAPEAVAASATGKRTEDTAIAIVARYGRALAEVREVKDVQDANLGWDLEFHLRDGRMIPVEVKGSSGSGSFVLTANELDAARAQPDFRICHVVDLTTPARTRIRVFDDVGARLTDDLLAAAGWALTGWRQLAPVEIPVYEAGSKDGP
jgi:hypothetical protein